MWDKYNYSKDDIIEWKCNNWYIRDDGIAELIEYGGEKVLLANNMKEVWISIDYEKKLDKLWEEFSGKMMFQEFMEIVDVMVQMELANIINENNIINQLFD